MVKLALKLQHQFFHSKIGGCFQNENHYIAKHSNSYATLKTHNTCRRTNVQMQKKVWLYKKRYRKDSFSLIIFYCQKNLTQILSLIRRFHLDSYVWTNCPQFSLVEVNRSQNFGPGLILRGISCILSAFGLPKQVFLFKKEKKDCQLNAISYIKRNKGLVIQFTAAILQFNWEAQRQALLSFSPAKDKDLLRKLPNADRKLPNLCLEWRMSNQKQRCIEIMCYFAVLGFFKNELD